MKRLSCPRSPPSPSRAVTLVVALALLLLATPALAKVKQNSQVRLPNNTYLGDIDGDGFSDYVEAVGDKVFVDRVDAPSTRILVATFPAAIQRLVIGDFDPAGAAHGRDQICAALANGNLDCRTISADHTTLTALSSQTNFIGADEETMVGDIDGDGGDDIFLYKPSTGAVRLYGRHLCGGPLGPTPNFSLGDLAIYDLRNKQIRLGNMGFAANQVEPVILDPTTGQLMFFTTVSLLGQTAFVYSITSTTGTVARDEDFSLASVLDDGTADVVLHSRTTGAIRLWQFDLGFPFLLPITNVVTTAIPTTPDAQLMWGRFKALAEPGLTRDDLLVYFPTRRWVTRFDARFLDLQYTYAAIFSNHVPWAPPSLTNWLASNPSIANAIKWQATGGANCYVAPESEKKAWPAWTDAERSELVAAFESSWNWYFRLPNPLLDLQENIAYPLVNQYSQINVDTLAPEVSITESDARALFIAWEAQNLLVEVGGLVPWSSTGLASDALDALFDGSSYMKRCNYTAFAVGAGNAGHPNYVTRTDNVGSSLIAPPRATFAFLKNKNLIGTSRSDTIVRVLNWSRDNLVHFYNGYTFKNMFDHWQYRGLPITRIISGTTAPYAPGFAHWTAGCHGSTGFYRNVLRATNVPMQIVNICGHSLAYFMSEQTYMDHGDDPYNLDFKATGQSSSALFIDQATFTARFGSDPNNHGNDGDAICNYIGWETNH